MAARALVDDPQQSGEVPVAIIAAVILNLMGFTSFTFLRLAIAVSCLKSYYTYVKEDKSCDSQVWETFLQEIRPKIYYIATTLAMSFMR